MKHAPIVLALLVVTLTSATNPGLSEAVSSAIVADDIARYDAAGVQVSTNDAVVTLSGTVHRAAIRQRMAQVAHAVQGVTRVVNLLKVEPESR